MQFASVVVTVVVGLVVAGVIGMVGIGMWDGERNVGDWQAVNGTFCVVHVEQKQILIVELKRPFALTS